MLRYTNADFIIIIIIWVTWYTNADFIIIIWVTFFFVPPIYHPRHSGLAENDRDHSDNVPRFMRVIVVTMEGTNWILSLSSGKYIILERLGQHSKSYGTIQIKRGAVSAHCPPFSEKLHSCAHSDRVLWLTTYIHSDHLRGRLFGKYLSALIVTPSNPTFNYHFQQEYEYLFACLVCLYSEWSVHLWPSHRQWPSSAVDATHEAWHTASTSQNKIWRIRVSWSANVYPVRLPPHGFHVYPVTSQQPQSFHLKAKTNLPQSTCCEFTTR